MLTLEKFKQASEIVKEVTLPTKLVYSDILEQKDAVVFCNIDDALHRTIADACKNKYLNMNLSQIYDQNIRIRILGEQPNNSFKGCCKTDK